MTPHKQMTEWDKQGVPYHVTCINWSSGFGGYAGASLPVIHHSDQWLLLAKENNEELWVNLAYVMNLSVERL